MNFITFFSTDTLALVYSDIDFTLFYCSIELFDTFLL